ncbi:hypothetical protein AB833_25755 [Chromatiales bacterium (ex Bugula neritina AB1)]|nr:hypothetical protein AB833_25755 [Chromatiales bacterium (ex Bugula neritina AB1)]
MYQAQPKSPDFEQLYRELEALPENQVGEIINGTLHASPRPSGPHGRAASVMGMDIGTPYDRGRGGPGGWWIIFEPELHLTEQVLVPDIAGWHHETLPEIPQSHRFTVAPDWVCEMLSPSTGRTDRIEKMPIYANEGVSHLWLVDPLAHTLETFALQNGRWSLAGSFKDNDAVSIAPFDAITLELTTLWQTSVSN